MKKILTLFAMALMVISVNAQILIAEKDWSGVSDNALPWIKFADPANGSAKGGADGIEINVTKVANQWEPQGNVCEGFDLTAGASYRVVIVAKVGSSSDVAIQMGGWDNWLKKSIHVDATGDFQEIVCDFSNYSYDVENAHVLFLCGHTLGTSIVKKIEVFRVINKKRAVHVSTAGTLPQLITNSEKSQIEELTLTGYLNGTDIACIRRMAGAAVNYDYDNISEVVAEKEINQIYGKLYILDISGATIVSGGSAYKQWWYGWPSDAPVYNDLEITYGTSDNTISKSMFDYCKFAKVVLPNNITKIESGAFCNSLTEIVIPQSVTSIDNNAFGGCSDLTSIKVESGNQKYDSRNNCNAIIEKSSNTLIAGCKNTIIPNSVTSIGDWAFSQCSGLTSVTIPSSVTSIGNYAFYDCSGLTSVTIPSSVTSIGGDAFYGCSGLTSVTIPNSVTSIGDYAFYKCSLALIKVESGNQKYDSRNNCNAIIESSSNTLILGCKNTIIPNSVTSIGKFAFSECSGLTSVTIPNSVTSIGSFAFSGCSGLTFVNISDLAAWCNIEFGDNPLSYAHHLYINGNEITNLVIPNGVTSISSSAFSGCSGLTSVTIPHSVTSISGSAFSGCSGLTSVTIGNSVESIGEYAFRGCSGLTSVTIPNSVTSIGREAFDGCSGLTSVTIPNSVTSIGDWAFYGCSGLTSVSIPNSVSTISHAAFWGCSSLTSVTIPNGVTSIGDFAFNDCSGLTSILSLNNTPPTCEISYSYSYSFSKVDKGDCVLWVPKGSVSAYKTADVWKDFQNIRELTYCDVNLDGEVNQVDLDATVDFIMGKDPEDFFESLADLNGDDVVDAADVVKLVTILNIQEGLSMDYQTKYSNQVVSSLSCTLNNDGDKAIQLTKCELYCNHSVVSSSKFKVTLAKGESKKCSFDELENLSSRTGFSLVWYYTYNGEDYTYRCEIEE